VKTIELTTASRPLSEYVDEIGDEVVVLTANHQPIAAIVSLKGVDRESLALSTDAAFLELIERARGEFAAGQTLSLEEMKRAVLP
jgi:antitoxin (DNA-binding transcriptional repressor) of toxin-antitoxin stability system